MKKYIIILAVFSIAAFSINHVNASSFNESITLNPGWNIISTPRIVSNHSFSAAETSDNFDIYILSAPTVTGWATMADLGQSEFAPLYGYFINNKTGSNQTLTLNYKDNTTPNQRLFERNFSKTGWYSIGPAQPTYTKTKCTGITDSNNVASILYPLSGKYSAIVDFTDSVFTTNPNSVAVESSWKSVIPADANSINDFRELKGYAIYINEENALYSGFQNNTEPVVCLVFGNATINSSFASPSYVIGSSNAKIASFKIENLASSTESLRITGLSFDKDNNPDFDINNLKVKVGANQFGVTQTAVADSETSIQFTDNTNPSIIDAGNYAIVDVYADIAISSVDGDYISLIDLIDWTANGFISNDVVISPGVVEGQNIRLETGDIITITFNGPVAGDIAVRGQDVNLLNFTIAAKNNIEIRNLRLNASTTGAIALYSDIKVWDTTTNSVVTSAQSITTSASSTNLTFTDIINISAGSSKSFKVTADVDSTNSASGTIHINILAFQSNDIKSTDNNTFVAVANIVPNSTISGNDMTIRTTTLDVQLSATPTSQTYVQGVNGVALAGYSLRAIAGEVKVTSIKITATSSTGTLTSGEVQSLGLYDGATLVGTTKSLDSTALTATFDNLNYTIASGNTKVLTLKGNISANANSGDAYYFYIASYSTDVTAYDTDGNSATISGINANSDHTVTVTIISTGTVTVARAPDDTDSQAGIVIAGTESVLGKFRFTATNEDMTLNKLAISVIDSASATATSTAASDESPKIKLYDGSTLIGDTGGYTVTGSGANAGTAYIQSLGWVIPKNSSKVLTVKGVLNTVSGGADAGASVYANVMTISSGTDFEAAGQTNKQATITGATGNLKVVYKTKPTIGAPTAASSKLTSGLIPAIRFTMKADGPEQVAWQQIQFKVSMTGATMTAIDAVPSTSGTVQLKDVDSNTTLNIASGFSSTSTATGEQVAFQGGTTGYVSLYMNAEQVIAAGTTKTYELSLTFANLGSTAGTSYSSISLYASETTVSNGITVTGVSGVRGSAGTTTDASPSFVWSDYSNTSHSASTADWANGVYVQTLPSVPITLSN